MADSTVCIVTTCNRPDALARSLPQIVALGAPVLVVDDGSPDELALDLANHHGAACLRLPHNRGLACALNVGLSYWLADTAVEWISVFQDDVDVRPDCLEVLARIAATGTAPIMTGHDAAEHAPDGADEVASMLAGILVRKKRNSRATHMHGRRDYWQAVMPIPTRALGAPKRTSDDPDVRGLGSNVDFWIYRDCPESVVARGGHVLCVPGLVRTFLWEGKDSTWNNTQRAGADPELRGATPG